MSTAYEQGRQAYREGKPREENPHMGEMSKAGVRRCTDAGLDWARGYRDQADADIAKHGVIPQVSDFVKHRGKR